MAENDEITVSLAESGNTPNIFVWRGKELIVKIWLYPDGGIDYRSFVPHPTHSIRLRDSQIRIEKDIKFDTPPKKKIPMSIRFKMRDDETDQKEE